MRTLKSNKEKQIIFLEGALIGALIFILIYGVKVLDATYDSWLLNGGDISQHYVGWQLYRKSSWGIPFGLIDNLLYPNKVSVIYMDSIPIFALIFKALSPILPNKFQYFGIWGILCFMLQGGLSSLIIYRFSKSKIICAISSMLFIAFPVVLQRMYAHTALAGNWIILLAIYIYLLKIKDLKLNIIIWSSLASLSVTIHMYFFPMIMIFLMCHLIRDYIENKKIRREILIFSSTIICTFIVLLVFGAFVGKSSYNGGGLGAYSTNINSLVNPLGFSRILKDLPVVSGAQGEGFAYLGLGVIILCIISLYIMLNKVDKFDNIRTYTNNNLSKVILVLGMLLYLILALSPSISLNNKILFTIPYPEILVKLLGVFRASGRFIWPICYLITIYALRNIILNCKKSKTIIIFSFCIIIQFYDLSGYIYSIHKNFSNYNSYTTKLQSELWTNLKNGQYKHIDFLYDVSSISTLDTTIWDISEFAINNNMTLSDGLVARKNVEYMNSKRNSTIQDLKTFNAKDDTIYILSQRANDLFLADYNLNCYYADGIAIGVKDKLESSEQFGINSQDRLKRGINVLPKENQYLNNGEDTGSGRVINTGGISYGPYLSLNKGKYKVTIIGENMNSTSYDVSYDGGKNLLPTEEINRNDTQIEYNIMLDDTLSDLEFRIRNNSDTNIKIEQVILSSN